MKSGKLTGNLLRRIGPKLDQAMQKAKSAADKYLAPIGGLVLTPAGIPTGIPSAAVFAPLTPYHFGDVTEIGFGRNKVGEIISIANRIESLLRREGSSEVWHTPELIKNKYDAFYENLPELSIEQCGLALKYLLERAIIEVHNEYDPITHERMWSEYRFFNQAVRINEIAPQLSRDLQGAASLHEVFEIATGLYRGIFTDTWDIYLCRKRGSSIELILAASTSQAYPAKSSYKNWALAEEGGVFDVIARDADFPHHSLGRGKPSQLRSTIYFEDIRDQQEYDPRGVFRREYVYPSDFIKFGNEEIIWQALIDSGCINKDGKILPGFNEKRDVFAKILLEKSMALLTPGLDELFVHLANHYAGKVAQYEQIFGKDRIGAMLFSGLKDESGNLLLMTRRHVMEDPDRRWLCSDSKHVHKPAVFEAYRYFDRMLTVAVSRILADPNNQGKNLASIWAEEERGRKRNESGLISLLDKKGEGPRLVLPASPIETPAFFSRPISVVDSINGDHWTQALQKTLRKKLHGVPIKLELIDNPANTLRHFKREDLLRQLYAVFKRDWQPQTTTTITFEEYRNYLERMTFSENTDKLLLARLGARIVGFATMNTEEIVGTSVHEMGLTSLDPDVHSLRLTVDLNRTLLNKKLDEQERVVSKVRTASRRVAGSLIIAEDLWPHPLFPQRSPTPQMARIRDEYARRLNAAGYNYDPETSVSHGDLKITFGFIFNAGKPHDHSNEAVNEFFEARLNMAEGDSFLFFLAYTRAVKWREAWRATKRFFWGA